MSLLTKRLYGDVDPKIRDHIKECIICFEEFKPGQSVIELKCNERHFFHSPCLERWLKQKLECPLCKIPI
jgi:hypothetical protein